MTPEGLCTRCSATQTCPQHGQAPRNAKEGDVIDYEALDPGIRDIVRRVNTAGFETTDSGDGVSKPADWYESGEAMPFRHIAATAQPMWMVSQASRLADLLGPGWEVEATYSVRSRRAYLFARELTDRELAVSPTPEGTAER